MFFYEKITGAWLDNWLSLIKKWDVDDDFVRIFFLFFILGETILQNFFMTHARKKLLKSICMLKFAEFSVSVSVFTRVNLSPLPLIVNSRLKKKSHNFHMKKWDCLNLYNISFQRISNSMCLHDFTFFSTLVWFLENNFFRCFRLQRIMIVCKRYYSSKFDIIKPRFYLFILLKFNKKKSILLYREGYKFFLLLFS